MIMLSRLRKARRWILLIAVLVAVLFVFLFPEEVAPNWSCLLAEAQVALASPYQKCTTECTSYQKALGQSHQN